MQADPSPLSLLNKMTGAVTSTAILQCRGDWLQKPLPLPKSRSAQISGEMVPQLRQLASLSKDLDQAPITHTASTNCL